MFIFLVGNVTKGRFKISEIAENRGRAQRLCRAIKGQYCEIIPNRDLGKDFDITKNLKDGYGKDYKVKLFSKSKPKDKKAKKTVVKPPETETKKTVVETKEK